MHTRRHLPIVYLSIVTLSALLVVSLSLAPSPAAGQEKDPFRQLRVRTAPDQLGPIRSIRQRQNNEKLDPKRRKRIAVKISTSPAGARVYRGRRRLGVTPLVLRVPRDSTPLDLIIRAKGFMTLRTRIERDVTRGYAFRLTPSKFR